jgi:hypothetical protein
LGCSAPHFEWKKALTAMRASPSPSSCSSLVQTPPGSLRSIASSKCRLELSSPWRLPLCGQSTNPRPQRKAPSNCAVVAGVSPAIPDFAADTPASAEDLLAETDNPWIVRPAGSKFGKFSWMQNSSENLEAVHNTRSWASEIRARVHKIDLAAARRRK